jgi:DNA-directed RNA polymerase specialized sigma subunit
MKAKTFMSRAHRLDLKINTKLEQLEQYRSLACKVTNTVRRDKVKGGENISIMEDVIIKITLAEQTINESIDQLVWIKGEITDLIDKVTNEDGRLLMELRYLCYKTWDEIADKMYISNSYAYQLHRRALKEADEILELQGRRTHG